MFYSFSGICRITIIDVGTHLVKRFRSRLDVSTSQGDFFKTKLRIAKKLTPNFLAPKPKNYFVLQQPGFGSRAFVGNVESADQCN